VAVWVGWAVWATWITDPKSTTAQKEKRGRAEWSAPSWFLEGSDLLVTPAISDRAFVVSEAEAAAIRAVFDQQGE
jgi:hypothetical protein